VDLTKCKEVGFDYTSQDICGLILASRLIEAFSGHHAVRTAKKQQQKPEEQQKTTLMGFSFHTK